MNLANFLGLTSFCEHSAFFVANKIRVCPHLEREQIIIAFPFQGLSISETRDYLNMENDFLPGEFDILANDATWRPELLKEGLISQELADQLDAEEAEVKKKAEGEKKAEDEKKTEPDQ